MADFHFLSAHRIRKGVDFKRVFERRASVADSTQVVYGCENEFGHLRLGLSVSRKVGNAVVRNRWKRRIREAFRMLQPELKQGIDLVVIPRRGVQPDFHEIHASMKILLRRVEGKLARGKR